MKILCSMQAGSTIGVFAILLASSQLLASSFTVSPTRISLSKQQQAITVRLLNMGDQPVVVQAHVMAWSLRNNEDVYETSDDVLLNPPIFTLQPQKPQLMRLGLRKVTAGDDEIAYRLIVEEVPPVSKSGEIELRTILRIAIPIFVAPHGPPKAQLTWKAEALASGQIKLTATDTGNLHVQVKQLTLDRSPSQGPPATKNVMEYLLPGKTAQWTFDGNGASRTKLSLKGITDAGDLSETLDVTSP